MPIDILMPALSPTMETGTLAKWLVKEGDTVSAGQVLAEIETDKATMEYESADEGTVGKILVAEGTEDVAVGTKIAVLLEEGESADALAGASEQRQAAPGQKAESPKAEAAQAERKEAVQPQQQAPEAPAAARPQAAPAVASQQGGERIKASPLARRIAGQKGIDLAAVKGSGPNGRIVKADIEAFQPGAAAPAAAPAPAPAAAAAPAQPAAPSYGPPADVPFEEVKLSNMRKVIARRLQESKQTVPHFYLTVDCEIDALLKVRKELNGRLEKDGVKVSVNDFVIRAVALALKKVPAANVQFAGDKMYWFKRQDISVAVAIEGGLVTPVVKDAGSLGLGEISRQVASLAEKARSGKLAPEEYQGGTFSISNLGMYGIKQFEAVINPPQACILAVGAGEQRAVIKDGAVAAATVMSVTLSCDHRAVDGAVGAEFLQAFKRLIEDPLLMLA
ncbi:pyruvate dehydrogenase complex dihydrolipoamide acetyltransferase [Pedomonas mirosovicensis]|uniref:pyruvate dehydrogenase complex dihydrolipoamide acetyltransferase n=1 Tax=Pedomonas mirosovicensis TaxID=2908641 RepID=UPI0021677D2E|nr:pyruvate dehydrogenase complex dihydrolipoamide acetyltransferase [Pedomonas mirosovicensis]MCH8685243.1 pyruvate dehydrogenase complex dihydrolipoamide acetyltransferase [Pedomonas mirosovicensis]